MATQVVFLLPFLARRNQQDCLSLLHTSCWLPRLTVGFLSRFKFDRVLFNCDIVVTKEVLSE
jgi:hypothetical protein